MTTDIADFDYAGSAELYPGKRSSRHRTLQYRRFDNAAEALRYIIEEMPSEFLAGAVLETETDRFEAEEITALYDNDAYPLPRADLSAH